MENRIYILSYPEKMKNDEYKVGYWNNTKKALESRYKTYLVRPEILYFKKVANYKFIENKILSKFDSKRLLFKNGKKSEWINVKFEKLKYYTKEIINEYGIFEDDDNGSNVKMHETNETTKDARLRKYLKCLEKERWDNEKILLGAIIFNEGGSLELFKEFMDDDENCEKLWKKIKNKDVIANIIKLMHMAKKDDPVKYKKACLSDIEYYLNKVTYDGISDKLAANIFYLIYNDKYIFDQTIGGECWYTLNKYNIWERDVNAVDLQADINKTLPILIDTNYNTHASNRKNEQVKLANTYSNNHKFLSKNSSKRGIVNELKILYKQKRVSEKMDKNNPFIFAFKNGVYDLKKLKFRKPKPEEFIMMTVGYNYIDINEKIEKAMLYIEKVIKAMMPTEEDYKYLLKTMSLLLKGHKPGENREEELYIWKGNGGNGRGLLNFLMQMTLGEYFVSVEMNRLCRIKPGTQSFDRTFGKHVRTVVVSEKDTTLQELKLKQVLNYLPNFKIIVETNETPNIETEEIMNKIRCINFPYKFVYDPKLKNEKKADDIAKSKFNKDKYKLAFFHILLKFYKSYVLLHDMIPSQNVINEMELIKSINDPITPFIEECLEITDNKKDLLKPSEINDAFKQYYSKDHVYSISIPMRKYKEALLKKGIMQVTIKGSVYYQKVKINEEV